MEIYDTNNNFDFSKIQLTKPTISSGGYFIKFLVDSNPLYIQPPKCRTRQGIIKAGKRLFCDLMFTNDNEEFIQWMENLEANCQQTIYKNREKWFDGNMELHDIENYFTSTLKIFKSGKFYVVRTNISTVLGKPILKIYDEDENEIDFETITDDTGVMTILEVQGIKCSSKSFQIEIEMKQLMVLRTANIFEKCIIRSASSGVILDSSKKIEESNDIKISMQSIFFLIFSLIRKIIACGIKLEVIVIYPSDLGLGNEGDGTSAYQAAPISEAATYVWASSST